MRGARIGTGRSATGTGDELLGLAATLLDRGARQVVASVIPVADDGTADLMVALHCGPAAGLPPAAAQAPGAYRPGRQD